MTGDCDIETLSKGIQISETLHQGHKWKEIILIWIAYKGIRWYDWSRALPAVDLVVVYFSIDDVDQTFFSKPKANKRHKDKRNITKWTRLKEICKAN